MKKLILSALMLISFSSLAAVNCVVTNYEGDEFSVDTYSIGQLTAEPFGAVGLRSYEDYSVLVLNSLEEIKTEIKFEKKIELVRKVQSGFQFSHIAKIKCED